jgi:uncharacterized protein with GYD domain
MWAQPRKEVVQCLFIQYDHAVILEAPDDETVAKFALALGSQGNVRTETLRASTEDEFRQLINALP